MDEIPLEPTFERFRRDGDVEALAQVFDLAAPRLLKVARRLCGDEAEAEDALQETFRTVIEKQGKWDARRPLLPWMTGILSLHAKKAREKAERRVLHETPDEGEAPDPARLAEDRELGELLEKTIGELPKTYVQALRSYLFDGKPAREIGSMLGISPNAASVRLHRGLELLRRALPSGAALGLAGLLARPTGARGLDIIRGEVLAGASKAGGAALAGGGAVVGGGAGALLGKPLAIAGAVALAAGAVVVGPELWPANEPAGVEHTLSAPSSNARLDAPLDPKSEAPAAKPALADNAPAGQRESADNTAQDIDPEAWLERFRQAQGWRAGLKLGYEIADLAPEDARDLMRAIYHRIPDLQHRQQILKPFVFDGGHVFALDILDLAATDESLEVQAWAFGYLEDYAYQDFSENYEAYQDWRARTAGLALADVLTASARDLTTRLLAVQGKELASEMRKLKDLDMRPGKAAGIDLTEVFRSAGLVDQLGLWLRTETDDVRTAALQWVDDLGLESEWLEREVLPLLRDPNTDGELASATCRALGRSGNRAAIDPLFDYFERLPGEMRSTGFAPVRALAAIGDARVIPRMIAIIQADPSTAYAVGYFGLSELTGVTYDESHDAAFWTTWWTNNQERLPREIRGTELPTIQFTR